MHTHPFTRAPGSSISVPARFVRTSLKGLAASALACAALAMPVLAQSSAAITATDTTPHMQSHHHGQRMGHQHANHEQRQLKRAQRRQQRMAQLRQQLALTPAQEPAWKSFEQAMQAPASGPARIDRQALQQLTTPERIDRMRELRAQRAAAMDARGEATKAFYAQLQPAQQQSFDQAYKAGMRHGHHGGKRHGGERASQRPDNAG